MLVVEAATERERDRRRWAGPPHIGILLRKEDCESSKDGLRTTWVYDHKGPYHSLMELEKHKWFFYLFLTKMKNFIYMWTYHIIISFSLLVMSTKFNIMKPFMKLYYLHSRF
jgi:hypothetical protein